MAPLLCLINFLAYEQASSCQMHFVSYTPKTKRVLIGADDKAATKKNYKKSKYRKKKHGGQKRYEPERVDMVIE